ncbi:D-cysteine desulfhydrase family protein [Streptomyces sp. NPDC096105]|uniref:D-cysteine desulfhydrase family protein n=1 Tax=Streptomyces sp. NPDC096105 TaxID=3366074 RepID=UPI00382D81BE
MDSRITQPAHDGTAHPAGPPFSPLRLGTWPTPLEPAPRLATALGLRPEDLWIKRDDLTGLAGGGNKIRKLEWTVAKALAEHGDTLVTTGAAQSNHARLTAAAGARLGLDVVLVLQGEPPAAAAGNLLLDSLLGARLVWAGDADGEALDAAARETAKDLRKAGATPALIPFGGSSALGARGYLDAGSELLEQCPDVQHIVVALGSGGTMAGLVAAAGARRVLGVDTGARRDAKAAVHEYAAALTHAPVAAEELRVRTDQIGAGYGTLTPATAEALSLAARCEGVVLDPVYTGRALAGLRAAVRDGDIRPGETTVLVHTGGLPGFFGHSEIPAVLG